MKRRELVASIGALGVLRLAVSAEQGVPHTEMREPSVGAGSQSTPAVTVDVGNVLRQTFQATIDESVPDEMLDLLAKLS